MKISGIACFALAMVGCTAPSAEKPLTDAPLAILQAMTVAWQETSADGHLCLDPVIATENVLAMSNATSDATSIAVAARARADLPVSDDAAARWPNAMLDFLARDTLVAITLSDEPTRRCTPTRQRPAIAFSVPEIRGDTARAFTVAFSPAGTNVNAAHYRLNETFVRRGSTWKLIDRNSVEAFRTRIGARESDKACCGIRHKRMHQLMSLFAQHHTI